MKNKSTVTLVVLALSAVVASGCASTDVATADSVKAKRYAAFQRDVREYKRLQREQDQRELLNPQEKARIESLGAPSSLQERLVVPK